MLCGNLMPDTGMGHYSIKTFAEIRRLKKKKKPALGGGGRLKAAFWNCSNAQIMPCFLWQLFSNWIQLEAELAAKGLPLDSIPGFLFQNALQDSDQSYLS